MTSANDPGKQDGHISTQEAGRLLGVSRWTVRRMIRSQELAAIEVRGMLRVELDSVTRYIAEHRHKGWD